MELSPGTVFANDYEVQRELSAGGMGRVYVVLQRSTGKQRALKLMLPQLVSDPALRKRFEQEAKVASLIQSDHVVEVVGAGIDEASGAPWLAMEFLRGGELSAASVATSGNPLVATHAILRQICHAVGAAHAAGIVHRDLKPENLFLAESKRAGEQHTVKVLDFGIAKIAAEASTQHTAAIGSPIWMAPEQSEKGTVTPAADVWSLGLITYYLLSGKYYWNSAAQGTLHQVLRELLFAPIVPASERAAEQGVAATLPPWFDAWFALCLNRDPAQRFADASALFAAFDAQMRGSMSVVPLQSRSMLPSVTPHAPTVMAALTAPAVSLGEVPPKTRSEIRRVLMLCLLAVVAVVGFRVIKKQLPPRHITTTAPEVPVASDSADDDSPAPPDSAIAPSPTLSSPDPLVAHKASHVHHDAGATTPTQSLSAAMASSTAAAPPPPSNEGGFERVVALEKLNRVDLSSCGQMPGAEGPGRAGVRFDPDGHAEEIIIEPESMRGTRAARCVVNHLKDVHVPPFQGKPRQVAVPFNLQR